MDSSRLSLFEIESHVRSLRAFPLSSVGSDAWMQQHTHLEQLNFQAHYEAQQGKHDEYVVEQFLQQGESGEKFSILIHELLVIEAWKHHVFPLLLTHFTPLTSVKAYIVLYHEATIVNLLEILTYHASMVEHSGDAVLELADYCHRKLNALNTGEFASVLKDKPKEDAKSAVNKSVQDTLKQQLLDINYSVAVCTIGILRFLTDHVAVLPLGVLPRMLHTHDVLLSCIPLIEKSPFTRRLKSGDLEKFYDQQWHVVPHDDTLLLTRLEGQVWLCIYNLIMDKSCRKIYEYNTHRKEILIRLKKYFNEILLDQLPLLRELKRFVEELSIMDLPPPTASSLAIIETVPEMRVEILKDMNYQQIANEQKRSIFSNDPSARQKDMARLAATYNFDSFDDLLPKKGCATCGKESAPAQGIELKKCSRCKSESYCGRACQVAAWKKHQAVCDVIVKTKAKEQEKDGGKSTPAPAAAATTKPKPATTTTTTKEAPVAVPQSKPTIKKEEEKTNDTKPTPPSASAVKIQPVVEAVQPAPAPVIAPAGPNVFASGKIVMLDEMD